MADLYAGGVPISAGDGSHPLDVNVANANISATVNPDVSTTGFAGTMNITAANTAQQVTATNQVIVEMNIQNDGDNTATIYAGFAGAGMQTARLDPGDSLAFRVNNTNKYWVLVTALNGDGSNPLVRWWARGG